MIPCQLSLALATEQAFAGGTIRDGEHQQRLAISLIIQLQLKDAVSTKLKQGRTAPFDISRQGERAFAGAMGIAVVQWTCATALRDYLLACIDFKISIGVFDVLCFGISSFHNLVTI